MAGGALGGVALSLASSYSACLREAAWLPPSTRQRLQGHVLSTRSLRGFTHSFCPEHAHSLPSQLPPSLPNTHDITSLQQLQLPPSPCLSLISTGTVERQTKSGEGNRVPISQGVPCCCAQRVRAINCFTPCDSQLPSIQYSISCMLSCMHLCRHSAIHTSVCPSFAI